MKNVLIAVFILFLLFGVFREPIIDGIKSWRTNDTTQASLVDTTGGKISANVTLSYDLFQAALAEVESITSSNSTDTAGAIDYDEATKVITIGGLTPEITRTLTIRYLAETTDSVMRLVGPFLAVGIFGAIIVLAIIHARKKN